MKIKNNFPPSSNPFEQVMNSFGIEVKSAQREWEKKHFYSDFTKKKEDQVKPKPLEINATVRILKFEARALEDLSSDDFECVAKKIDDLIRDRELVEKSSGFFSLFFNRLGHWIQSEGFNTDAEFATQFIDSAKKKLGDGAVENYFKSTNYTDNSRNYSIFEDDIPSYITSRMAKFDEKAIENFAATMPPSLFQKNSRVINPLKTFLDAFLEGHQDQDDRQEKVITALVKGLKMRQDFYNILSVNLGKIIHEEILKRFLSALQLHCPNVNLKVI